MLDAHRKYLKWTRFCGKYEIHGAIMESSDTAIKTHHRLKSLQLLFALGNPAELLMAYTLQPRATGVKRPVKGP